MKTFPLSQVVQINPRAPQGLEDTREISFVPMASVSENGGIILQETRKYGEVKKGFTYFQRGDVLLAKITPCFENGKSALADNLDHPIGFGSTEFHILRAIPGRLDSRFLYHMVRSKQLLFLGQKSMKGAAGHKRVPAEFLENFEVPEYSLDDQIRIAHLLGKVEGMIVQRKEHLQQLDDLLKSVFLEMFGDPVKNEKGWDKKSIGAFTTVGTGATPSRKKSERYFNGHIPWVKTTEVQNRPICETEEHITDLALAETNCSVYPPGTILLAMYGQGKTRGQVGFLRISAATNQACAAIAPSQHNQIFVYEQLKYLYRVIRGLGRGGNQENLNLSLVRGISLILPSEKLQNQFAAIVEKVESIKSHYQESLTDLETLYDALSQQAFKGDLDLSRVNLPTSLSEENSPVDPELPAPVVKQEINLPEANLFLPALEEGKTLQPLLHFWLDSYHSQLGGAAFCVKAFTVAARERLAELNSDHEFELGPNEYEYIKAWVFDTLANGALTQKFDNVDNRVEIKAVYEKSLV